jgi:ATP-dependent Clp protease ATP-binding subunit ClpC
MEKGVYDSDGEEAEKPKKTSSSNQTPNLDKFGKDLTKLASLGKLDPVIGREKEIDQTIEILNKRKKHNVILVGAAGSGKNSIVEGLAMKIYKREVDRTLVDKKIIELNITSVVAGTKYRGEFEQRMEELIKEIQKSPDVIVFIDEIHTVVGAGGSSGAMDAANIIKPALARGEMKCIGATTLDEYKKIIENDSALDRRFQRVYVSIPTKEETFKILKQIRPKYEEFHDVSYSDEILKNCVEVADRYIPQRNFPDKAIDLMDEVGAKVKINKIVAPESIKKLEAERNEIIAEKKEAAKKQDYEGAAILRDRENKIAAAIEVENTKWKENLKKDKMPVEFDDIAKVISIQTGIPINKLTDSENEKLAKMDKFLKEKIIGQDQAVDKIVDAIQRSRLGIHDPSKPALTLLCLGATGTGKSYLAKILAQFLFDTDESFIKFDMSEYMEKHSISKLIGSPPGYVGHEDKGQLTEKIKNRPYSVVLFDEIEKAHPDIFNIFLQIMDEGRLTDATGKEVNFKNTIIILTSNIGTEKILSEKKLGFSSQSAPYDVNEMVMSELKKKFKPELINRIDEKIVFKPLEEENVLKIVDIELDRLIKRLDDKGFKITIHSSVKKYIAEVGYDRDYGARPLKRAITTYIESPLAKYIIHDKPEVGVTLKLVMDKKENRVVVKE